MADFPPEAHALATTIEQLVADDGPLTEAQITERLAAAGALPGRGAGFTLQEVLDQVTEQTMPLCDRRWVSLPKLLRSRVFTHRVTEDELAHDVLAVDGDLSPLLMLFESDENLTLADGTRARQAVLPFDRQLLTERGAPADAFGQVALVLEPNRLAALGLAAGAVVGLRLGADGIELLAVREDPAPAEGMGKRLADVLPIGSAAALYDTVIWTVLEDGADLLRDPTVPLEEALAQLGYVRDVDWVAPPGFDFAAWRAEKILDGVLERYDLDVDEAAAVVAVVKLYERVADLYAAVSDAERSGDVEQKAALLAALDAVATGADAAPGATEAARDSEVPTVRDAVGLLAEPAVTAAVLAEAEFWKPDGAAALGLFAETLAPLAPRPARPALRWLQAKAYERLGALAEAEQAYAAAEDLDDTWPLTLYDLARYAADRGDCDRALTLLRRAGAPADDEFVEVLERFRPAPRSNLGRNDRCWCGSGRKYKQCHLHREQLPLEERAAWLYEKARMSLQSARARNLLLDLADQRARYDDSDDALLNALDDPIVTDAALFEGDVFLDFLAARGELLPEDERALAQQWLLVDRSVHEVRDVRPGAGFTARDVRTGDVHEVREWAASARLEPGDLFCARIVPAGATMQIFGGLEPVPPQRRDALVALLDADPDPAELIDFLTRPQ